MGWTRGLKASIVGGVMIAASSLGAPTPAFAISTFCASGGRTLIFNQGDFTTIDFGLEQGETLTFAIAQLNGNPANPQVLSITNLLTSIFNQAIPEFTTLTATFTQTQNVSVTNISFLQNLLNGGVPGSGVPLVIQVIVTCTPVPTPPPAGGGTATPPAAGGGTATPPAAGGGTTVQTPAQQRGNLDKSAADLTLGGSNSSLGEARSALLLTEKRETFEEEDEDEDEYEGRFVPPSLDLDKLDSDDRRKEIREELKKLNTKRRDIKSFGELEEIDKSEKALTDELNELNEKDGKVHGVQDEVKGIFVPVGFPARANPISDPRALRLTRLGDKAASFVVDLKQAMVSPASGHVPVLPQDIDIWFAGKVSILEDGSSVDRSGYVGNMSFGIAKKLSEQIALAVELTARSGQVDINQLQSNTDYKGVGLALSGAFAITEEIIFTASGSYERGRFDTSLASATGSFNSDKFGANAGLSGTYQVGEFVLQPGIAVTYSSAKLSSYTDSAAVFVPGQTTKNGNFNSSLTISRTLAGGEKLISWQPYVTGRAHYNFSKEKRLAISPTLVVNDSRFNGEIGGGAQFNFPGGINASIGATYFGLFGNGVNTINFGVNLTVPLN